MMSENSIKLNKSLVEMSGSSRSDNLCTIKGKHIDKDNLKYLMK